MTEENKTEKGFVTFLESSTAKWITAIATLLSIIGFGLSIPSIRTAIIGAESSFSVERVSEIPVFNVNQRLPGLNITFNDENLMAARKQIIAARIRFHNTGSKSVTPVSVSELDPIGISIFGGEFLRITALNASSDHLSKLSRPFIAKGSKIYINKNVIFDADDSVSIDVIIIKPSSSALSYVTLGKIEGTREINYVDLLSSKPRTDPITEIFGGGPLIQLVRLVSYFILSLAIIGSFIFIAFWFSEYSEKKLTKKRKIVADQIVDALNKQIQQIDKFNVAILVVYGPVAYHAFVQYATTINNLSKVEMSQMKVPSLGNLDISSIYQLSELIDVVARAPEGGPYRLFTLASSLQLVDFKKQLIAKEWLDTLMELDNVITSRGFIGFDKIINTKTVEEMTRSISFASAKSPKFPSRPLSNRLSRFHEDAIEID